MTTMKWSLNVGDVASAEAPAEPFPFADPSKGAEFRDWYAKQSGDGGMGERYGRAIFVFAIRWARAMENALGEAEAVTFADIAPIAEAASTEADNTPDMGISGFMYGAAVQILARYWRHGEALRRWHNREYDRADLDGNPGASVNPALMTISVGSAGDA